jgi:carboxylesterase type B
VSGDDPTTEGELDCLHVNVWTPRPCAGADRSSMEAATQSAAPLLADGLYSRVLLQSGTCTQVSGVRMEGLGTMLVSNDLAL